MGKVGDDVTRSASYSRVLREEVATMTDDVETSLMPAGQVRDRQHRWRELERELADMTTTITGPRNDEAIRAQASRLQAFFVPSTT